jgi:hypothetical protein
LEEEKAKQKGDGGDSGDGGNGNGSRGFARAARVAYAQGLVVMALTAAAVVMLARWLSPWVFWGYVGGATGITLLVVHGLEGWDSLELRLAGEERWDGGSNKAA